MLTVTSFCQDDNSLSSEHSGFQNKYSTCNTEFGFLFCINNILTHYPHYYEPKQNQMHKGIKYHTGISWDQCQKKCCH